MTPQRLTAFMRGSLATTLLAGLLAGVPYGLVTQVGWPLPTTLPSWQQVSDTLTSGQLDSSTVIQALAVLLWVAWAQLTANVVAEALARLQGRRLARIPGPNTARTVAANLIASAAVLFSLLGRTADAVAEPPHLRLAAVAAPVSPDPHPAGPTPSPSPDTATRVDRAPGGDAGSQPPATEDTAVEGEVWHVQHRDTLWDIAEQTLGDGRRWRELHRLNVGRPQPDGATLTHPEQPLHAGWVLVLPADATTPQTTTAATASTAQRAETARQVIVERGDTLWDLAEQHLGDPYHWPALYHANRGRPQPDGRELTDPDLIYPGWTLELPTAEQTAPPREPADTQEASPDPGTGPGQGSPDHNGAPRAGESVEQAGGPASTEPAAPGSSERPSDRHDSTRPETPTHPTAPDGHDAGRATDPDSALPTDGVPHRWVDEVLAVSGIGLAAAGLIATLDRVRRGRRRRREPGQRIPLPEDETFRTELRIRGLADPDTVALLDAALDHLAAARAGDDQPLPPIALVSTTAVELGVHFAKPDPNPPEGWRTEDHGRSWLLPRPTELEQLHVADSAPAAVPPLLVSLGTTDHGRRRVLLNLGHAGLLGLDGPAETCRAMLLHQAVELATTARNTALQVVLCGLGQGFAGLERVTVTDDVEQTLHLLDRAATFAADAEPYDLDPAVGFFFEPLEPAVVEHLAELTSRAPGAVAAVVAQSTEPTWQLSATDDGLYLSPAAEWLAPLELTATDLDRVEQLVWQATDADYIQADDAEPEAILPEDRDGTEAPAEDRAKGDDEESPASESPEVEVRILGPVEIVGTGPLPSRKAQELLVYLALHRKGADLDTLCTALWPREHATTRRLHTQAWRVRQALGDAPDGQRYLPNATNGRYTLSPQVGLDYDRFRHHVTRAQRAASPEETVTELRAALELVRGEPFSMLPFEYEWALHETHTITQTVTDAAHWFADLSLESNQPETATWAAEQGLRADPYCEPLYRALMRAAAQAGNTPEIHTIIDRLRRLMDDDDTNDTDDPDQHLDPTTLELYEQLTGGVSR